MAYVVHGKRSLGPLIYLEESMWTLQSTSSCLLDHNPPLLLRSAFEIRFALFNYRPDNMQLRVFNGCNSAPSYSCATPRILLVGSSGAIHSLQPLNSGPCGFTDWLTDDCPGRTDGAEMGNEMKMEIAVVWSKDVSVYIKFISSWESSL